tara:strand:+ start:283 stop:444 length:162 start_codon:yes stop_codon:yes gene_type:complete
MTDEKTSPIKAVIVKVDFAFMKSSKVGNSLSQEAEDSRYYALGKATKVLQTNH